jgi:hypothetical protein
MGGAAQAERREIVIRTKVTYGQLDKVLRSLGFTCRLVQGDPPARRYEHKESGALITMPPFPETDFVLDYHLVGARTTLDLFGIAEPSVFDEKLQRVGRRLPAAAQDMD